MIPPVLSFGLHCDRKTPRIVIAAPITKKYEISSFNKIHEKTIVTIGDTFVDVVSSVILMYFIEYVVTKYPAKDTSIDK